MRIRIVWPASVLLLCLALIGSMLTTNQPHAIAQTAAPILQLGWSAVQADLTRTTAWGDVDGDGDLDLAVGNKCSDPASGCAAIRLYRNTGSNLEDVAGWSASGAGDVYSLAWGDMDNDGDLDLAAGFFGMPVRVYANNGQQLADPPRWTAAIAEETSSISWGDVDNDGDLDLAVGNNGQPLRMYYNNNGTLQSSADWSSIAMDQVTSLAWGDVDNDGDLDLAVGAWQQSRLYENIGTTLNQTAIWSSPALHGDFTNSVAWGDIDNDGDLDLAIGNGQTSGQSNRLYENVDGNLSSTAIWNSNERDITRSVAWGDADNDGDLDLVAGNSGMNGESNRLYENIGGELTPGAAWSSTLADVTSSVAWGDIDGDGDLDLAAGNNGLSRVYLNQRGTLPGNAGNPLATADDIQHVALGDVDNDGDLDLAVANHNQPDRVYANVDGSFDPVPLWSASAIGRSTTLAWGDADGDGDLDLAVGYNFQPIDFYRNDGGTLTSTPAWSSTERNYVSNLAWGDIDGDGDLDLAAGSIGAPIRVYQNLDGQLDTNAAWFANDTAATGSIAWGDVDNDGDLDLAAGNPARLYRNDNGSLTADPVWIASWRDGTAGLAWGDVDGDGDLDLATANAGGQPNRLYRNQNGNLSDDAVWTTIEADTTTGLAWGDVDGDGDLDLAISNAFDQPNRIYLNHQGTLARSAAWTSAERGSHNDLAFGDIDNDGDLDLVVGTRASEPLRLYRNQRNRSDGIAPLPVVFVAQPGAQAGANYYANAEILDGPIIEVPYTLRHSRSQPVRRINVEYSLNGGDNWYDAVPVDGTATENLATAPGGVNHTFRWDVYASGVMGRYDNVVLRVTARPDLRSIAGKTPGPFLSAASSAQTLPFRLRGSQVRVLRDGAPVAGALVYRQPAAGGDSFAAYAGLDGEPFRTDGQGYLQGNGEVNIGDRLVATLPISQTELYTLLYSSAAPTVAGLASQPVTTLGVQTLMVSADNPLILFNLDVALEWDASLDERFMAQLQFNLQRASELLFDWTDGQVALGEVTIHHNAENWNDAQIRIYASNRLRPNANQGGVVTQPITDAVSLRADNPVDPPIRYAPGQVHMGAIWNRYGEAYGDLGEDWPRAFAHELGHFLLFLDDNYLGLDAENRLVSVDSCPGAMSNPYNDENSEFHPAAGWLPGCASTLSQNNTGRPDWTTITTFYNFPELAFRLREPAGFAANPGPRTLPLEFLAIQEVEPDQEIQPIAAPIYSLTQAASSVVPENGARAFLFRPDDQRLIDLGRPNLDQVTARGARPGDRLCIFDPQAERLGCVEQLDAVSSQVPLAERPGWSPEIIVTPVNSTTLRIDVRQVDADLQLQARVFPMSGTTSEPFALDAASGSYQATVTLAEPSFGGYVQVWVAGADEPQPRREAIVDYALGGNPSAKFGSNAPRGRNPSAKFGSNAPAVSFDGQAVIYGDRLTFLEGQFFTLQSASRVPPAPPGRTPVGLGYWLSATDDAPALEAASLSINYLSREVPAAEENGIEVYYWNGQSWTALDTRLRAERNEASALIQGPGLYTLMASYRVPLSNIGWNLIAYPVPGSRAIDQALTSIRGLYTTVYGYTPGALEPWQVFDIAAPDWVNNLHKLEYGKGYWINARNTATLYIEGEQEPAAAAGLQNAGGVPIPPATFYGVLRPTPDYSPVAGTPVVIRNGNIVCGQSETYLVAEQVVYKLTVPAAGGGAVAGCGIQGQPLTLQIGELELDAVWDNSRVLNIEPRRLYLPEVYSRR